MIDDGCVSRRISGYYFKGGLEGILEGVLVGLFGSMIEGDSRGSD